MPKTAAVAAVATAPVAAPIIKVITFILNIPFTVRYLLYIAGDIIYSFELNASFTAKYLPQQPQLESL